LETLHLKEVHFKGHFTVPNDHKYETPEKLIYIHNTEKRACSYTKTCACVRTDRTDEPHQGILGYYTILLGG